MIPRKKLDIGWADLACGLCACFGVAKCDDAQDRLERFWSPAGNALACLSVRSGFDLLLQHLALPRGSEILMSAITIRDMAGIVEQHGLTAVPVDLARDSCAVQPQTLERAITENTKAIVIAHLFGSRAAMDSIVNIAQRYGLFLCEDCAQAFAADGYRGHPGSDAVMFSFGTIKTATAGGGALFSFRETALCRAIAGMQCRYPLQRRGEFIYKLLKIATLKALLYRLPYTLFVLLCRAVGKNHDRVISNAVRGFPGDKLMRKLRHQPPAAMLVLLERRLRNFSPALLAWRKAAATRLLALLPPQFHVGARAELHSHWVFPILSQNPDLLVRHLWQRGFDATRGASSLIVVTGDRSIAAEASNLINHIVYLPFETCDTDAELQRLAHAIVQFARAG